MSTGTLPNPATRRTGEWSAASPPAATLRLPPLERWHLLSLDAPTLATLWTWFLSRCFGVRIAWQTLAAMFVAVWILYAADRLLDARAGRRNHRLVLEDRHRFHARHRRAFLLGIAAAGLVLLALLAGMPRPLLVLYVALSLLLALWLGLVHASRRPAELPKELAVGAFFAAAVALPAVFRGAPHEGVAMLAPLVAVVASANCFFLAAWELEGRPAAAPAGFIAAHRAPLAVGFATLSVAAAAFLHASFGLAASLPALACALSACALLALDRLRTRFGRTTFRALADVALLTPLLFSARLLAR